jgi:hypothetical protein
MGSAIPLCGHHASHGTEDGASPRQHFDIVVVAGQTQIHVVTLATVRHSIVPPMCQRLGLTVVDYVET